MNSIDVYITGEKAHIGKTMIATIIAKALEEKLPGCSLVVKSLDGDFLLAQKAMEEHGDEIAAKLVKDGLLVKITDNHLVNITEPSNSRESYFVNDEIVANSGPCTHIKS
jgi:hypothetical protein